MNIFNKLKIDYLVVLIEYMRDYANGEWKIDKPLAYNHINEVASILLLHNFQDIQKEDVTKLKSLSHNTIGQRYRKGNITIDSIIYDFSINYQKAMNRLGGDIPFAVSKSFMKIIEKVEEKEEIVSEKSKLLESLTSEGFKASRKRKSSDTLPFYMHQHVPIVSDFNNLTDTDIKILATDFTEATAYVFHHIKLPPITKVQRFLCYYLQHSLVERDIIIEQFRGIGKSLITSIFAMWLLLNNRELKVLVISGTTVKAKNFVRFCYNIMEKAPLFNNLKFEGKRGERTSVEAFDVFGCNPTQDPSVKSLGVGGTITSARANVIIVDDAETKVNSRTASGRALLWDVTSEFDALLTAGALNNIIYLGTRHHADSLYHRIREERKFKHIICPVEYPANKKEEDEYNGLLAPHVYRDLVDYNCYGECTDERFDRAIVDDKKIKMGKTAYEMQMLLRVKKTGDIYPLSLSDITILDLPIGRGILNIDTAQNTFRRQSITVYGKRIDDEAFYFRYSGNYHPLEYTIMTLDPSGRGADMFGYSIVGILQGSFFLLECSGVKGGYKDENLDFFLYEAKRYKVGKIYIESNFGDGTITELLKKRMIETNLRFGLEEIRATKNKTERLIDTLEPIFNMQKFYIAKKVIDDSNRIFDEVGHEHSLVYQMSNLIKDKVLEHDDSIDALEMAIQPLKHAIQQSPKKTYEKHLEKERALLHQENIKDIYPPKPLSFGGSY